MPVYLRSGLLLRLTAIGLIYAESTSFNGVAQMYRSMTYPNPGLRPENIASWEGGIEFGLFDDRFHADVAYYQKVTTDQIMSVPTSYTIGSNLALLWVHIPASVQSIAMTPQDSSLGPVGRPV